MRGVAGNMSVDKLRALAGSGQMVLGTGITLKIWPLQTSASSACYSYDVSR